MNWKWYYHWLRYKIFRPLCMKSEKSGRIFTHRAFLDYEMANLEIGNKIESGKPFMACRIGAGEAFAMRTFHFNHKKNMEKCLKQICTCAGFFPEEREAGYAFALEMENSLKEADLCGTLIAPFDDYFIQKNMKTQAKTMHLGSVEPYFSKNPWSKELKGKKVLVIHPFSETISEQFKKQEKLFQDKDILPKFTLCVYKAVQTSAGEADARFQDWFEALEFMAQEISKIEFDIALLGCGAYGLPLASRIKRQGKQAIHMGGGLQLLFGIRGKRWDEMKEFRELYNENWTYPNDKETPKGANQVEGACYW